jgi:adenosyl cobinamide kinase/adenosyl cobinamide phosphate guanylyltransferase
VLYLIGGPARSGKGVLAQRLLRQKQVPYFSVDYLTTGLADGAPGLGIRHELPNRARGEPMWSVLAGMLRNIVEVEPAYVVEGDVLLPDKVAGLSGEYRGCVRACFSWLCAV